MNEGWFKKSAVPLCACFSYFDSVDVCKIRPDDHESRMRGVFPSNAKDSMKIMKLTVFSTTEVELGLFQEGLR